MSILVFNAGSSTLKFAVFDDDAHAELACGQVDWAGGMGAANLVFRSARNEQPGTAIDAADHRSAAAAVVKMLRAAALKSGGASPIRVVGHRVVHGGVQFRESTLIDPRAKTAIAQLAELAPLHNPPTLATIEAAESALPDVPHVAVFDTAFFADLPPRSHVYPLPYEWYADWGIRRFGFHGISHAYCAGRAAEMLGRDPADLRIVICHLGNGCSASATRGGVPVATTMGFTPLDGLMMGTRPGSLDPGILLFLQRQGRLTVDDLEKALNYESGLLGVSGVSSDFRQVERAAERGSQRARLAVAMYAASVRSAVGALSVTLGGIDALIFTAGVGENSSSLRSAACDGLECLGLLLDRQRNDRCQADADIATTESPARILVIHTREDVIIAGEARRVREALCADAEKLIDE